jgi:AcrR family transcriptional regulator
MTEATSRRRGYNSPLREEQAARTRRRIVEAAAELFSTNGYGGTTMNEVARAADVSVESVHAAGPKASLLLEAFRQRYTGDGGWTSILELDLAKATFAETDPVEGVKRVVEFLATGHARSARLMLELRTVAAVEPLVSKQWDEVVAANRDAWAAVTEWMVRIGIIEAPVPADQMPALAAALNVVMSAETYLQLTLDWGYDDRQYREWIARQVTFVRP